MRAFAGCAHVLSARNLEHDAGRLAESHANSTERRDRLGARCAEHDCPDSLPRRPARLRSHGADRDADAAVAIAGGYRSYTAPVSAPPAPMRPPRSPPRLSASFTSASRPRPPPREPVRTGEHPGRTAKAMGLQSARRSRGSSDDPCRGRARDLHRPMLEQSAMRAAAARPGVFEPFPAGSTPVGASLRAVRPWTMNSPDQFRPEDRSAHVGRVPGRLGRNTRLGRQRRRASLVL